MLQAWYGGLRKAASGEAVTFPIPVVRLALHFLIFILTARGSEIKKKGLVMVLLLPFLPSSPRLSLIVQQQIWVVMTSAVGHHHRADGAGIDVLDLEEAFDHVDVLWFNILWKKRKKTIRQNNTAPEFYNPMTQHKLVNSSCDWHARRLTWKALLSHSTEQDVVLPIQCRFPEIRWVSFSQQPNTSYGLFLTRDSSV